MDVEVKEVYACGHEPDTIIMNCTVLSLAAYLDWKDSTGFEGDFTECFSCYCSRTRKEAV